MAIPVHGLPPLLHEGLIVAAVPPQLHEDRWLRVERATEGGAGQLVRLDSVTDIDTAESLVGRTLLACVDDLPDELPTLDVDALIGREVVDSTHGSLGRIEEVMRGPANDVWCVVGESGETLVPVVGEFVGDITREGPIRVSLPDGLVGA